MTSGADDTADPYAVVRDVLADPNVGRENLPQLFDLLASDDSRNRLSAAWCLCLVTAAHPDAVESVTKRLAEELADGTESQNFEAELAFAYVRHQFSETVTETLSEVAKREAIDDIRTQAKDRAGGFARANYIHNKDLLSRDIGRTTIPEGGTDDPRSVYQNRANENTEPEEMKDLDELLESRVGDMDGTREEARRRQERKAQLQLSETDAGIEDISEESYYDRLTVVEPGIEGRFASIYRTRAVRGNIEEGIAISLFRRPESGREAYVSALAGYLDNWDAIADHKNVQTLHDWSADPTPWVATDYTVQTLYDRIDLDIPTALTQARQVARAISYAHQRGVLHAGIDPYNVVYADTFMDDRQAPMVKNFGLMNMMRQYFEPSTLLDPRYAAPEYYDRDFGDIDNRTDIYQLGAVIYKLFAGRPPFEGDYNEVRASVLNTAPPSPSDVDDDIPRAVDDIVRKSMAKQKLTRYETAKQLVRDLDRVTDS